MCIDRCLIFVDKNVDKRDWKVHRDESTIFKTKIDKTQTKKSGRKIERKVLRWKERSGKFVGR